MDYEKLKEHIRNQWFKDHEYKIQQINDKFQIIDWRNKNGDYTYYVRYIIDRSTLFVRGDLYDAIYQWGGDISIQSLAGFNFGYFASKCQASQYGRGYETWDEDTAKENLKRRLDERCFEEFECIEDFYPDDEKSDKLEEMMNSIYNKHEWVTFINTNQDFIEDIFGQDYWEFLYDIGNVIDGCCYAHLEGLRMIWEQMESTKNGTMV